jgi:hypothetical protein
MAPPRVYADFQNIDDANRLRLTCAGTWQDLAHHGIQLHEGLEAVRKLMSNKSISYRSLKIC